MPHFKLWVNPFNTKIPFEERIFFLLRFSTLGCFIGHGFWGVMQKSGWLPFMESFGIPTDTAFVLMRTIGFLDIGWGIVSFIWPSRALLIWMAFWTFWTACLRPLSAMSFWEVIERGGNFGPPIAFLVFCGAFNWRKDLFKVLEIPKPISLSRVLVLEWIFRCFIALLLIGHGGFGVFEQKELLLAHFNSIGVPLKQNGLQMIGAAEMILGCAILYWPVDTLIFFALFWKIGTELLYPIHGRWFEIFETIERMGDYTGPLGLWLIMQHRRALPWTEMAVVTRRILRGFVASYSIPVFVVAGLLWADQMEYVYLPYEISMNTRPRAPLMPGRVKLARRNATLDWELESGRPLLDELRTGGNIVVLRHFQTAGTGLDLGFNGKLDETPISHFENCSWQRMLNLRGEQQAKRTGEAIAKLGIKWTRILSSPMCRARQSAELLTGQTPELVKKLVFPMGDFTLDDFQRFFLDTLNEAQPGPGENVLIVGHSQMGNALSYSPEEGEAIVLRPVAKDKFKLIGKIRNHEWPLAVQQIAELGADGLPPTRAPAGH